MLQNVWFQYGVVSFGASTGCGTGEMIRVTRDTCTCNVQATRMATPGSPPTWTSSRTPLDCSTNNALNIFFHFPNFCFFCTSTITFSFNLQTRAPCPFLAPCTFISLLCTCTFLSSPYLDLLPHLHLAMKSSI